MSRQNWIIVGVVGAVLIVFSCCGGAVLLWVKLTKDVAVAQKQADDRIQNEPPLKVELDAFIKEFDNQPKAQEKYRGKVVQFAGKIDHVTDNAAIIDRYISAEFTGVECIFDGVNELEDLLPKSTVTIRGLCDGPNTFKIRITRCRIVRSESQ